MTDLTERLRADIAVRTPWQRLIFHTGTLLFLAGLAHVVMLAADGWNLVGPVSWRKPIVFGVSLGLALWSAGWVLGHLPRRRLAGWAVAGTIVVFSVLEWGLITLQTWRGVASHFNNATAFDATVFTLMGAAIACVTLAFLGLLVWAAADLPRRTPVRWAALTGLVLLLVAGGLGGDLVARGNAAVTATGAVPDAVMIGAAGTGKVAHAVGLHGIQVLGAIAVLLGAAGHPSAAAVRVMRRTSLAYTVGFGAVVAQVYSGRALFDATSPWTSVVIAAAAVVIWNGSTALRWALTDAAADTDDAELVRVARA